MSSSAKRKTARTRRANRSRAPRRTARRTATDFAVRFWGVRGSIPAPGPLTSKFGGNTPCVEVRCGDELIVFDLGSGARALGEALPSPVRATIFLSHYHYDHLQGLPFFAPAFDARSELVIAGPTREGRSVQAIVAGQMRQPYFPVGADVFRARIDYREVSEEAPMRWAGIQVSSLELSHPGGTLGYRVDYAGRSMVYATDVEYGSPADARVAEFAQDTDLLIYDAMYTEDEYEGRVGPRRVGWGHSTWVGAVKAAQLASAKRLALFHHEPTRDDPELERVLRSARRAWKNTLAAQEQATLYL